MEHLAALVIATGILILIPGPNAALIVANSLAFGFREGLVTVAGTTLGVGLQLLIVIVGMSTLIELASEAFAWLRWIGVAYLVWLGVVTFRTKPDDLSRIKARRAIFLKSCLVAAVNPKTLVFNAAFLPQFVPVAGGMHDVVIVGVVFLAVLFAGDVLWALFAASASRLLGRLQDATNRIAGLFLVRAGLGLALARRSA